MKGIRDQDNMVVVTKVRERKSILRKNKGKIDGVKISSHIINFLKLRSWLFIKQKIYMHTINKACRVSDVM